MVAESLISCKHAVLDERNEEESPNKEEEHNAPVSDPVSPRLKEAEIVIAEHGDACGEDINNRNEG